MTDKCPDNERTLRHRLHIGTAQTMKRVKGQFVPLARALFLRLVSQTSPTLPPALTHLCPHQHPGPLSPYLCHIKSSMHAHKYQCYRHLPLSHTYRHTGTHTFLAFPAAGAPGLAAVIAVVTGVQLAVSLSPGSSASERA